MLTVKRNVLCVALASAIAAYAGHAGAQETRVLTPQEQAEADAKAAEAARARNAAQVAENEARIAGNEARTLDTVEVTGIRAAIEASIDTKRDNTSIVEAISSEDIGKLPDTSIADSLARLPGLTAQRFGNRPQEINIRGFAGDFSTALLNGREQVSLGNNRGVEFDQYPSELTNSVTVYKTTDASLVGQGLSGTVGLHTVRPLDFDERIIAVNFRGDTNELANDKVDGDRFSVSYIDQFNDGTVGLALGYAQLNNPTQGHTFGSWGYDGGVIQGADVFDTEGENERDGFMATFEYRPNEDFSTTLDFFYSKFDRTETKRGFQFSLQSWTGAVLNGRTDSPDGTAIGADFSNVNFGVIRNDVNGASDNLISAGWNADWRISDYWRMTVDLSHSGAKRKERILETYARLRVVDDDVNVTFNPDGYFDFDFGIDLTDPANFALMDPGGWGGSRAQAGYLKDFIVDDTINAARVDFNRSFETGPFSSLDFGLNVSDREKSRASDEFTLCTSLGCTDNTPMAIPAEFLVGTNLSFAGMTYLGLDALGMLEDYYFLLGKDHPDISNKNWEINETLTTAYAQLNIDTDLGSIPVRGNIGLQAVRAQQDSTGVDTFAGVALGEPASFGKTRTDVLPSLNLAFQFPADQFLRVGASRQMMRPRMDHLRSNRSYGYNQQQQRFEGGGGNPDLDPYLANSYDLSYEKYFGGNRGYVGAAFFYKDLKTWILEVPVFDFDYSQLPIPVEELPESPPSFIGTYTGPINLEGGYIRGWEFAVSLPLDLAWAPLEGFGIQANYSSTESEISPQGIVIPIPGLSKYVTNASVYYERYGFQARVSARHRSRFLGEVQGFGGDRVYQDFDREVVTDVQVGYTFQSGPLENLGILLQVNNLENEPYRTVTTGFNDRPRNYSEYGRTFLFGISYKW